MKKSVFLASALLLGWVAFGSPVYAGTASNTSTSNYGGCPEDCPGCTAALKAREDYILRDMAIQKDTVLKEELVKDFPNCQELIDLLMLPFNIQYMSFDIAAFLEILLKKIVDAACEFILTIALGYINGIIGLFNNTTELPYGLGNVATLNTNGQGGTYNPNIPSTPGIPSPSVPSIPSRF